MAEQFKHLSDELRDWVEQQPMFFVATAATDGRVNLSPKGQSSLKVTGPNELIWLNLTGSGNETAAHLAQLNRMTIMWCAFEGLPRILRVYGTATTVHPRDEQWAHCSKLLPSEIGARQYYIVNFDLVQTSCGYAVPFMEYQEDRTVLRNWSEKRGQSGVEAYWAEKNQTNIDGLPTGIIEPIS